MRNLDRPFFREIVSYLPTDLIARRPISARRASIGGAEPRHALASFSITFSPTEASGTPQLRSLAPRNGCRRSPLTISHETHPITDRRTVAKERSSTFILPYLRSLLSLCNGEHAFCGLDSQRANSYTSTSARRARPD